MVNYEYRVHWRRSDWDAKTSGKVRIFSKATTAESFLAKLRGDERPELSPAEIRTSYRPVGEWTDGWPS